MASGRPEFDQTATGRMSWSADFSRVESRYGDVADLFAATEVYEWVVRHRPAPYITLRQGARVIERSKETLNPLS